MVGFGISILVSLLIECLCITPLNVVVMVTNGLVFSSIILYGVD